MDSWKAGMSRLRSAIRLSPNAATGLLLRDLKPGRQRVGFTTTSCWLSAGRGGRMPDPPSKVLMRFLPRRIAHDIFEPALHDLWIEHLTQRGGIRFTASVILLFLDCWRMAFTNMYPPREQVFMFFDTVRHALRMLRREPGFTAT